MPHLRQDQSKYSPNNPGVTLIAVASAIATPLENSSSGFRFRSIAHNPSVRKKATYILELPWRMFWSTNRKHTIAASRMPVFG